MLVRLMNGNVEDLFDEPACNLIARGLAERVQSEESDDALILRAESSGGPAACVGIEMATLEPKAEHAVLKFFRTGRSKSR